MLRDILFRESIPDLQQGLDVAALRMKVTADNVANVATPGYQAKHVTFEEELRKQAGANRLDVVATSPGHMSMHHGQAGTAMPRVEVDTSPSLRSGVNNVDVEREMAGLQKNNMLNGAMSQLVAAKYKLIREAITDRTL